MNKQLAILARTVSRASARQSRLDSQTAVGMNPDPQNRAIWRWHVFAACACLLASPAAQSAELGRLFFTQNERVQLERQHVLSADEAGDDSRSLIVNGVIQRDGGKRIIWINGEQQPAGPADSRTPASVTVILPGKTESVKVKVGQRLMLDAPEAEPEPKD